MSPNCGSCTTRRRGSRRPTERRRSGDSDGDPRYRRAVRCPGSRSCCCRRLLAARARSPSKQEKTTETTRKLAGVLRRSSSSATRSRERLKHIAATRRHQAARQLDVGRRAACRSRATTKSSRRPRSEGWTYDIDCRDGMKQRADALFAQYTKTELRARPGVQRSDRCRPMASRPMPASRSRAPEDAVEVEVGAKGLDHHGRACCSSMTMRRATCAWSATIRPQRLELAKLDREEPDVRERADDSAPVPVERATRSAPAGGSAGCAAGRLPADGHRRCPDARAVERCRARGRRRRQQSPVRHHVDRDGHGDGRRHGRAAGDRRRAAPRCAARGRRRGCGSRCSSGSRRRSW